MSFLTKLDFAPLSLSFVKSVDISIMLCVFIEGIKIRWENIVSLIGKLCDNHNLRKRYGRRLSPSIIPSPLKICRNKIVWGARCSGHIGIPLNDLRIFSEYSFKLFFTNKKTQAVSSLCVLTSLTYLTENTHSHQFFYKSLPLYMMCLNLQFNVINPMHSPRTMGLLLEIYSFWSPYTLPSPAVYGEKKLEFLHHKIASVSWNLCIVYNVFIVVWGEKAIIYTIKSWK